MREILFRGKRVDNDEWVEGMPCSDLKDGVDAIQANFSGYIFDIIPETLGQYTGLKDKNGTKIFEGDIVAGAVYWLEKQKNGIVAFRDGSFGLIWHRGDVEQFNPFTSMCNIEYEVIGNIHDNEELLKGGESDA